MEKYMKIVMLCGAKSSGKTTTATAIYGYHLVQQGVIPNANINDKGRMSIVFDKEKNEGIYFDIDSTEPSFLEYKNKYTDAYINHAGFADELKRTAAKQFGLDFNKLIGTDDEKNEECHIKWRNIAKLLPTAKKKEFKEFIDADKFMTNRQFLEVLGTDIFRTIYEDCHINSAYNKLCELAPDIAIIPDCRFANEFEFFEKITDHEVIKIKLNRNPFKSTVASEVGLAPIDDSRFDLVVPEDMPLIDRNNLVINYLVERGVLSSINIKAE